MTTLLEGDFDQTTLLTGELDLTTLLGSGLDLTTLLNGGMDQLDKFISNVKNNDEGMLLPCQFYNGFIQKLSRI